MKRMFATVTVLSLLALACGEGDDATTTTDDHTPDDHDKGKAHKGDKGGKGGMDVAVADSNGDLDARWNGLGLPVGDGQVVVSDATVALLVWESADFASRTQGWKSGFDKGGWTVEDSFKDTGFEAAIFKKDDSELGWAIGTDQGAVLVYLEDLTQIPAEESTVMQAKTSNTRITRNTRPRTLRGSGDASTTPRTLNKDGTVTGGDSSGSTRQLNRGGSGSSSGSDSTSGSGGGRSLGR